MILTVGSLGIVAPFGVISRLSPSEIPAGLSDGELDGVFFSDGEENGYQNGALLDRWSRKVKPGGFLTGKGYSIIHTMKAVNYRASMHGGTPLIDGEWWRINLPVGNVKLINGSCVLVGNGPSLDGSRMGDKIDSFDEVVRFNNFVIRDEIKEHIGSRTTIWSCYGVNASTPRENPPDKIINTHGAVSDPRWFKPAQIWRLPVSFYHKIRDQIRAESALPEERKKNLIPSAGLAVMLWLLDHHMVPVIHFCGFNNFNRSNCGGRHHYWLPNSYSESMEHDGELEGIIIGREVKAGRCVNLCA